MSKAATPKLKSLDRIWNQ